MFARKYSEWLASVGVPGPREAQPGEISSSSGFLDFPGELERLAELQCVLPEEVEVAIID